MFTRMTRRFAVLAGTTSFAWWYWAGRTDARARDNFTKVLRRRWTRLRLRLAETFVRGLDFELVPQTRQLHRDL